MKTEKIIRPVWAEIDLKKVRHNFNEVRRLIGSSVEMMAIIKAEAYGHGVIPIARLALESGATQFGVALPEEGIMLRQAGFSEPILVLGAMQPEQAAAYVEADLTAAVGTLEAVEALNAAGEKLGKVALAHLAIDTGMGRIGVLPQEALSFVQKVQEKTCFKLTGMFSHFATADINDKTYAKEQLERFKSVVEELEKHSLLPQWVHIANSAAIIDFSEAYFNLVRPGIILYGLTPNTALDIEGKIDLQPALSLKTKISFVKKVAAGTGISYGQCYRTAGSEHTIATIPIGYADGWSRILSGKTEALINGKRYPIVGNICMDQCMIDLGEDTAERGTEVTLIGTDGTETITADDIAAKLGTINYEVTCMLSYRVPRVYKN